MEMVENITGSVKYYYFQQYLCIHCALCLAFRCIIKDKLSYLNSTLLIISFPLKRSKPVHQITSELR